MRQMIDNATADPEVLALFERALGAMAATGAHIHEDFRIRGNSLGDRDWDGRTNAWCAARVPHHSFAMRIHSGCHHPRRSWGERDWDGRMSALSVYCVTRWSSRFVLALIVPCCRCELFPAKELSSVRP